MKVEKVAYRYLRYNQGGQSRQFKKLIEVLLKTNEISQLKDNCFQPKSSKSLSNDFILNLMWDATLKELYMNEKSKITQGRSRTNNTLLRNLFLLLLFNSTKGEIISFSLKFLTDNRSINRQFTFLKTLNKLFSLGLTPPLIISEGKKDTNEKMRWIQGVKVELIKKKKETPSKIVLCSLEKSSTNTKWLLRYYLPKESSKKLTISIPEHYAQVCFALVSVLNKNNNHKFNIRTNRLIEPSDLVSFQVFKGQDENEIKKTVSKMMVRLRNKIRKQNPTLGPNKATFISRKNGKILFNARTSREFSVTNTSTTV